MTTTTVEDLRNRWTELFTKTLPAKARANDPAQPRWPVRLDHCFGRIILDNVVGGGKQPWMKVVKAPAVKNMSEELLQGCIELGEKIIDGTVDLVELDKISLSVRGKADAKYGSKHSHAQREEASGIVDKKRRTSSLDHKDTLTKKPKSGTKQTELSFKSNGPLSRGCIEPPSVTKQEHADVLQKISSNDKLTPYRKRLYSTLLSVPRGRYTTYAAMSDYLESSARAVGNGMRNNPYAPNVPCHRVLAADGSIGGFHGDWGKEGKYALNKIQLLAEEGVRFDSRGRVYGQPFRDLQDLSAM